MNPLSRLARASVPKLVRAACLLALVALALMSYSILSPRPLPVILAMSVGHGIGAAAFACYLLAVVLDAASRKRAASAPASNATTTDPTLARSDEPKR